MYKLNEFKGKRFVAGCEAVTHITDALGSKLANDTHIKMRMAATAGIMKQYANFYLNQNLSFDDVMAKIAPAMNAAIERGLATAQLVDEVNKFVIDQLKPARLEDDVNDAIVEEIIEDVAPEELPTEVKDAFREVQEAEVAMERAKMRYQHLLGASLGSTYMRTVVDRIGRSFAPEFITALKG